MKYIHIILFTLTSLIINGQSVLLNQDFNSGSFSSWTLIDADSAVPYNDPSVMGLNNSFHLVEDIDSTNIGDSVLVANSWFNDTLEANNLLVTPAITFNQEGNYLYFDAKSFDGSYPEALQIYFSPYLNLDSILNSNLIFDTVAVPNIWTRFKVKLNSIAQNTPIYFAFRHYSNDQYILGLDNIRIESNDLTSNKENIKSKITIFPNPSTGTVNFNNVSEYEFIKIYNSKGQEIWNGILLEKMNLNFNPGNYFIKTLNEVIPFIVK